MPLHLKLKRGEKLLLNGAVLEMGQRHGEILIHNQSNCLRGSDLISAENANTPTRRLYYEVQMMIVEPAAAERHRSRALVLLGELDRALAKPDIRERLAAIRTALESDLAYRALSLLRAVLKYEDMLLAAAKLEEARAREREAHAALNDRRAAPPPA